MAVEMAHSKELFRLAEEKEKVRAIGHPELQDDFSAPVNFPSGASAVISQTLSAFEHHFTAKVRGTRGTNWAHWSAPDARADKPTFGLRHGLGEEIHAVAFQKSTGESAELHNELAAVVQYVRESSPPPRRSAARECSGQRRSEHAVPLLVVQLDDGCDVLSDAGVVDQNIW